MAGFFASLLSLGTRLFELSLLHELFNVFWFFVHGIPFDCLTTDQIFTPSWWLHPTGQDLSSAPAIAKILVKCGHGMMCRLRDKEWRPARSDGGSTTPVPVAGTSSRRSQEMYC